MALIPCPECSKQVSSAAIACPSCAYPIASKPAPITPTPKAYGGPAPMRPPEDKAMGLFPKLLLGAAGLFGAFLIFGFMAGSSPEAKAKAQKRDAIQLCWDEQKRKSLSSAEQQLIAGSCETMEVEFAQKFGHRP